MGGGASRLARSRPAAAANVIRTTGPAFGSRKLTELAVLTSSLCVCVSPLLPGFFLFPAGVRVSQHIVSKFIEKVLNVKTGTALASTLTLQQHSTAHSTTGPTLTDHIIILHFGESALSALECSSDVQTAVLS